ncbi:MAG: hypothetical protein AAFQ37_07470 [Bacteroidota bacterium]
MPTSFQEWLRLVTLLYMASATLAAGFIGVLFFFKRSGLRTANLIYGTLLILSAGVQLHFIFAYGGWLDYHTDLRYLPIYFSLCLPILFFYYVKLTLYPTYRLRPSDAKHFVLPLGQLLYLWAIWLLPSWRVPGGRYFYNPFYGGFEQALFITLFPLYIIFSYQYFRRRRRQINARSLPRALWYIHKLIKGAMLFVMSYAILGLSDFLLHKFFHLNPRDHAWFAALSAGSFSTLILFFCVYGFQVLLWGRRLLRLGRGS